MKRLRAILGSALFLFAAPGVVAGLFPYWITGWRFGAPAFPGAAFVAAALIALGAIVLLDSFARFAWQGRGTPAPIAPTETLVVSGWYRHVRNPMYVAVTALNIGQALLFANTAQALYAACIWLAFHLFVYFYEEPTLRGQFRESYDAYRRAVPRWLPRLTPWRG